MIKKTESFQVVTVDLLKEEVVGAWPLKWPLQSTAERVMKALPKLIVGLEYRIQKTTTELVI